MNKRKFFIQLFIITFISALFNGLSTGLEVLSPHSLAGWIYLSFFVVFVIIAFLTAIPSARDENKTAYIRFNLSLMFLKMLTAIVLVFLYDTLAAPSNGNHVIYFIIFYIIYSIFEYTVLSKLGYEDSKKTK